jgi:hypothetical protein
MARTRLKHFETKTYVVELCIAVFTATGLINLRDYKAYDPL